MSVNYPSLFHIMVYRLAGTKPLSESILEYYRLGTNFTETLIAIYILSFKKMYLNMSGIWRPFVSASMCQRTCCISGNVFEFNDTHNPNDYRSLSPYCLSYMQGYGRRPGLCSVITLRNISTRLPLQKSILH